MKKTFTKVLTLVLSLALVAAMCIPAFAANITINGSHTYNIYQVFTGVIAGDNTLSNLNWGKNAAKAGTIGEAAEAVKADVNNVKNYVDTESEAYAVATAKATVAADPGYYVAIDTATGADASAIIVKVVDGDIVMNPKGEYAPTFSKKIQDTNDSIKGDLSGWQDSADYDIGDDAPLKLTATVPEDFESYDTFTFIFHDQEEKGLTFNEDSVVVKVDGKEITSGWELVTEDIGDETFNVVFEDLKKVADVKAGSVITVEYTSKLNEEAHTGVYGEVNEAWLEYTAKPTSPEDETPDRNVTPKDHVIVFTYKAIVNKVDQNKEALKGAQFKLEKFDANKGDNGEWVDVALVVDVEGTTFTATGIDDGKYRLTETQAPAGYNAIDPIEFEVKADHNTVWEGEARTAVLTDLTGGDLFAGNVEKGEVEGTIVNQAGATLPETGGMGTVILYALGSILVMGAGVLMFTKFRTSKEN